MLQLCFLAEAVWMWSSGCFRLHQRPAYSGCSGVEVVVDVEGFATTTSWMLVMLKEMWVSVS
jgi:hypothetical protein